MSCAPVFQGCAHKRASGGRFLEELVLARGVGMLGAPKCARESLRGWRVPVHRRRRRHRVAGGRCGGAVAEHDGPAGEQGVDLVEPAVQADGAVLHGAALGLERAWWEDLMQGSSAAGLSWVAILGFIRISTNPRIFANPLDVDSACTHARSWLATPRVVIVHPGGRRTDLPISLLEQVGSAANLTTDAHFAALAIEHQAELHSTDADMARFPGLTWVNPLVHS